MSSRFSNPLTYAALILGSLAFSFPFFWMILTSIKQQNEMSPGRMQLFPRVPTPVETSPYVDLTEFKKTTPEDVPTGLWENISPDLRAHLRLKIEAWLSGQAHVAPYSQMSGEEKHTELVDTLVIGVLEELSKRLSDRVREQGRLVRGGEADPAFSDWKNAVLVEAENMVEPTLLIKLGDEALRSFQLGMARIQMKDGKSEIVNADYRWTPGGKDKNDSLALLSDGTAVAYQLQSGESFEVLAENAGGQISADAMRSFFVGLKGDQSWAQVDFIVMAGGKTYQSERSLYLWNSEWREEEFKFPSTQADNLDSRSYRRLREIPALDPSFSGIRVMAKTTKLNSVEAWTAKILLNYVRAAGEVPLVRYFATSISLVLLNVLLMIFACTMTGYAFARLEWPGRDIFFGILLATMMIPAQVTMIPNFLVVREIGWFNTLLPLWVPSFFGAPYFIFLVRQFLKNIPKDLEEAARMDGCGFLRVYWHVMLPLVKPTIASIAIFTFIGSWNNFFGPLIYLNDDRLYPMALGLFRLNLSNGAEMGLLMAASFIMTLPVIVIFFFLQRFFIQGLALSGSKE